MEESLSESRIASKTVLEKLIQKIIDKKGSTRNTINDDDDDELIVK